MTEQPQKISRKKAEARSQCCVDGFSEVGSIKRNVRARAMLNPPKSSGNSCSVSSLKVTSAGGRRTTCRNKYERWHDYSAY